MGRDLIHGKKSVWIVETVSNRRSRVSPLFKTTDEMADWLVSRGYSRKAAETFIKKGFAISIICGFSNKTPVRCGNPIRRGASSAPQPPPISATFVTSAAHSSASRIEAPCANVWWAK